MRSIDRTSLRSESYRKECMTDMKYVVILCDGMADYKLDALGGKTPMTVANKPNMNRLAAHSIVGMVKTVGDGFKPGSDVANLSVIGYAPKNYYAGRSPLEAASIGIDLKDTDVTFRCNLVTLSDEENFEDKTMVDYCADDISTAEAEILIRFLAQQLNTDAFRLYPGVSYRHCLVWDYGTTDLGLLTPPHDITGQPIKKYIPVHPNAQILLAMMKKGHELLKDHPVNLARQEKGLRPANAIWLWGEGRKKPLTSFYDKYGLKGAVVSAVDLIKGIGKLAGMDVIDVKGATGYIDTDFDGKTQAALNALEQGADFVYIHLEAPDECGHRNELENKIRSLELIDQKVVGPVLKALENYDDFKVMILPDHATPIALRTHVSDPVPFLMYHKLGERTIDMPVFDEENAAKTGVFIEQGETIMDTFVNF